jgi:hypothetical protein
MLAKNFMNSLQGSGSFLSIEKRLVIRFSSWYLPREPIAQTGVFALQRVCDKHMLLRWKALNFQPSVIF